MSKVKITVTQSNIDLAKRLCHVDKLSEDMCCPIGLAIKSDPTVLAAFHTPHTLSVGTEAIETHYGEITLPEKARIFIKKFDAKEKVEPFTFSVTVPK